MELSELTDYAREKYRIFELHKWQDFPGFSVLCHPKTGQWVALLMRQWDSDSGEEIQRCDLKCGAEALSKFQRPYLTAPMRMRGPKWVGVSFGADTEREIVFRLFDLAVSPEEQHGYTLVLASQLPSPAEGYKDTALPFAGASPPLAKEQTPERLRKLRRMFEYGREFGDEKALNFYRQAVFMKDYEDDYPWSGDFVCYFPTYRDLTTKQLRGYFSWRTRARKGDFQPISASAVYIYIYELLNGVGADSPTEAFELMRRLEAGFIDSGVGDARIRGNLRRWMLEFAVLNDLPPELARQSAAQDLTETDKAITVLRKPKDHSDDEVFSALCLFGGKKTETSPVLSNDPERGKRLFSEAWRGACAYRRDDTDLFTLCFGKKKTRRWYPLANAVYLDRIRPTDRDYALNDCRSFFCRDGIWRTRAYDKLFFNRQLIQSFLHGADAKLRRYLKTGRYLKEKPEDEWVFPYVESVIEADRKAAAEAARPIISIDLTGLDRIRTDAATTRDSLLTEEELYEAEETAETTDQTEETERTDLPLDPVQIRVLRALLDERDPAEILKENHLMPSIAADFINEAMFDLVGDTVIACEDDRLTIIEDYTEDVRAMLGGI